jgi:hypothetical protein
MFIGTKHDRAHLASWGRTAWMCEKCIELDAKIEHYRQLAYGINDPRTDTALHVLIDQLQAQKTALHAEGI